MRSITRIIGLGMGLAFSLSIQGCGQSDESAPTTAVEKSSHVHDTSKPRGGGGEEGGGEGEEGGCGGGVLMFQCTNGSIIECDYADTLTPSTPGAPPVTQWKCDTTGIARGTDCTLPTLIDPVSDQLEFAPELPTRVIHAYTPVPGGGKPGDQVTVIFAVTSP